MNSYHVYQRGGLSPRSISRNIILKLTDWLHSIKDEALREDVKNSVFVTGGCITSMLLNEPVNDYDLYFKNKEVAERVIKYYFDILGAGQNDKVNVSFETQQYEDGVDSIIPKIKSAGIAGEDANILNYDYCESLPFSEMIKYFGLNSKKNRGTKNAPKKYHVKYISSNAICLSDDIQIVTRFIGEPEKVHKYYDFVHATNYYSFSTGLVLNEDALKATLSKQLVFMDSMFPVCSIFRIRKFLKRNWTISAGEMFKIMYSISKLDLDSISVLQEQLMGVDSAYMVQVLNLLEKKEKIDKTYLFSVIDKVFNDPLSDDPEMIVDIDMSTDEDDLVSSQDDF